MENSTFGKSAIEAHKKRFGQPAEVLDNSVCWDAASYNNLVQHTEEAITQILNFFQCIFLPWEGLKLQFSRKDPFHLGPDSWVKWQQILTIPMFLKVYSQGFKKKKMGRFL